MFKYYCYKYFNYIILDLIKFCLRKNPKFIKKFKILSQYKINLIDKNILNIIKLFNFNIYIY
jgi:hypothetical protein